MNDPSIGWYGSVMSTNLTPRSPWAVIKAYVDEPIWMVAIEFGDLLVYQINIIRKIWMLHPGLLYTEPMPSACHTPIHY